LWWLKIKSILNLNLANFINFWITYSQTYVQSRVELLPVFKFTGKMVKNIKSTGKIGKNGKKMVKFKD
jgi:hypothetical protein